MRHRWTWAAVLALAVGGLASLASRPGASVHAQGKDAKQTELDKLKKALKDKDKELDDRQKDIKQLKAANEKLEKQLAEEKKRDPKDVAVLRQRLEQVERDARQTRDELLRQLELRREKENLLKSKDQLLQKLQKEKSAPYVHAVLIQLKKEAAEGAAEELAADAYRLLSKIKTVRGLWAGKPAVKATPEFAVKDYQVGLLVLFDDFDGLQKYLDDPLHKQFGQRYEKIIANVRVYDFLHQK
jgi:hypothetical protein